MSNSDHQIGIVVPTLNSAATLDWTLCSLSNQRDIAPDVIVVDSGSEDQTLDICQRWAVRTIYVPPGNMYRAINSGLQQTDTEWVTYLNSDDHVYPYSYGRLIAHGEQHHAALVYGNCDFIDSEGRFLFAMKAPRPARLVGLLQRGDFGFAQPAAIYRKSVFQELGGFDERFRYISDYDFFSRLILSGRKVANLEGPAVAAFRRHTSQLSNQCAPAMAAEWEPFRISGRLRTSPGNLFDLLSMYIGNSSNYLWRFTSKRAWPPRISRKSTALDMRGARRTWHG